MAINSQRIRLITILLICVMSMMFVALSNGAVQHKGAHREPTKIRGKSGRVYIMHPKAAPTPPGPTGAKASASTKQAVISVMPSVPLWLVWGNVDWVALEWDRNQETNVVGYRVYQGTTSRSYDSIHEAGNNVWAMMPVVLGTNYFVVTANDSAGMESDYSMEVFYVRPEQPHLRVWLARSNPGSVPSGVFEVQSRTEVDKPWATLMTVTNRFLPLSTTTPNFYRVGKK